MPRGGAAGDSAFRSTGNGAWTPLSVLAHLTAVFGTGALDVSRYGHVLQARKLVGVRGAGEAFDGLHYVKSVTSTFTRGSFMQSFSLARNGLLSTIPAVPE